MWKRVWAEISYNKKLFIVCFVLNLPEMFALSTDFGIRYLVILMTVTSIFVAVWLYQKQEAGEDKRDRMHICMPFSLLQIALSRILVFAVFLLSPIALYLVTIIFVNPELNKPIYYYGIISWFGIMVTYYVILNLGYDLKYFVTGIKKIIFRAGYFSFLALLALVIYDFFTKQIDLIAPLRVFLWNALFYGPGAVFYSVILLVLLVTRILVYSFRHTHVEKV